MKKGDANMWWIIIGTVIALVVLIVLMGIFTGKSGKLESGLLSCEGKGGRCEATGTCKGKGGTVSAAFECPPATPECCFGLKKASGEPCTSGVECDSGTCTINKCA